MKLYLISYRHKDGFMTAGNFKAETIEKAVQQAYECKAVAIESVREVR